MLCELMGVSGAGKSTLLEMYRNEISHSGEKENTSGYSQVDSRFLCDFSSNAQFLNDTISLIANSSNMLPTQKSTAIRMLIDTAVYYYNKGYHKDHRKISAECIDIQDELFMHRAFSFLPFCNNFLRNAEWYFGSAPVPDRVFILRAERDTLIKRIHQRNKSVNAYLYFTEKDYAHFIDKVNEMYFVAKKVLASRGVIVDDVDVDCSIVESFRNLKRALKEE